MARQGLPGAPERRSDKSEHELTAQLQSTWAIVACDLAEVGVLAIQIDPLRIGVIEGVE